MVLRTGNNPGNCTDRDVLQDLDMRTVFRDGRSPWNVPKEGGRHLSGSIIDSPLVYRRNRIGDAPLFSWLFANRIRCLWSSSSGTRILDIEYSTDTFQRCRTSDVNAWWAHIEAHTAHCDNSENVGCDIALFLYYRIIPRAALLRRFAAIWFPTLKRKKCLENMESL